MPIQRSYDRELPIPPEWRPAIEEIAAALAAGNYVLTGVPNAGLDQHLTARDIAANVSDYGCILVDLPGEAWDSARYIAVGDCWEVIVDLYTRQEGRSDLALHLTVRQEGGGYRFHVRSVHVP